MPNLTKRQDAVLSLIGEYPDGITSTQISTYLEMSISTTLLQLKGLVEAGKIFHSENDKSSNARRLYFSSPDLAANFAGKKAAMGKNIDVFESCRRNSKNYMITLLLRGVRQPPKEEA